MDYKKWIDRTAIAIVVFALSVAVVDKVYATQQTMAKFTGGTFGATDTVIANGNFSIDSSVSIGAFWLPSGQTYTLSKTNGKYVTLNNNGIFWKDSSTGIKTYPDSIIVNSATGKMLVSSGSGAITASSSCWHFKGTKDTLNWNAASNTASGTWTIDASTALYCIGGSNNLLTGATTPLVMGANAILDHSNAPIQLNPSASCDAWSLGSGTTQSYTFLAIFPTGAGTTTLPANSFTCANSFDFDDRSLGNTVTFTQTGNVTATSSTGAALQHLGTGANVITYNTGNYALNIGTAVSNSNLSIQNASTTASVMVFNAGSSTIAVTGFVPGNLTNPVTIDFATSTWNISGNWTFWSATGCSISHTSDVVNFVTNTNVNSTITSNGKSFYSININKGVSARTVTFADRFRCLGNLTLTQSSRITFANKAVDTVTGDYINGLLSTDTLDRNSDSLWLGGSFTGNLRVKNDLSRSYLYGTALCNFTCNGATVNYFDIRGDTRAKQMKLIDRYHGRKTMVTTGTLNTNGQDCFSDSFFVCNDSLATVLGDTISAPKITYGASAKPIIGTPALLYFGLALADTMRDSISQSLGKLVVNKTGSNVTFAGVGHYDTIQVIGGAIAMASPGDTQHVRGLSITTTSTCVLTAPIVVADSIYIAAGATVTYSGAGKIICLACKQAQGGNAAVITYPAGCIYGPTTSRHRHAGTLNTGLMISTGD